MKPIIYQVLPRLFGNDNSACIPGGDISVNGCGKMADFTLTALRAIRQLGVTHIWYTGIYEHATQTAYPVLGMPADPPQVVKGLAGSPYAVRDYYDVDPDIATDAARRKEEFRALMQRTHRAGLRAIIDFIPNHTARRYHSDAAPQGVRDFGADDDTSCPFLPTNNYYYQPGEHLSLPAEAGSAAGAAYAEYPARATGNDCFTASPGMDDWYDTVKLNYGVDYRQGRQGHFDPVPDTWRKMLHILLHWASQGVDGFRCDMAEMVPVEFWDWAVAQVREQYPHILFIAEIYNPAVYRDYLTRGRFDYLYDKVGLYDTLRDVVCCRRSATDITCAWQGLHGLEQRMLNFLENHDEQRIASQAFAADARRALPALVVSACMNTNPFMLYFGQELGEGATAREGYSGLDGRTTIFDYWSLACMRRWRDGGTYRGSALTAGERSLRDYYRRVLTLCNQERAISQGLFFDLTYANIGGWRFNEHRQFAFFRKWEGELLLIVVNFDPAAASVAVNLPPHAFHYLLIPQLEHTVATDLLTGTSVTISLVPYRATDVTVPGHGAVILKVQLQA